MINLIRKHSKGFAVGVMVALSLGAGAATFSVWSPGGDLATTSTWNNQTIANGAILLSGPKVTGTLPATNGGTGQATVTQGDLLYGASNAWSKLAKNTSATRYLANTGTNNDPAWGQIDLSNGVTSRLPLANLTQGSALSVLGVAGNATADNASITAGTDGFVLRRSGTTLGFGTVAASALPGTFSGFANPTASLGLTAVNGSATTAMRSDGAPALSQAIVPTWTGKHIFSASQTEFNYVSNAGAGGASQVSISGLDFPSLNFQARNGSANNKNWDFYANSTNNQFYGRVVNDANNSAADWLRVTRIATTVNDVLFPAGMRSQGPVNITPTANGTYTAMGTLSATAYPAIIWNVSGAAANTKTWRQYVDDPGGTWILQAVDDTGTPAASSNAIAIGRTGNSVTSMAFGSNNAIGVEVSGKLLTTANPSMYAQSSSGTSFPATLTWTVMPNMNGNLVQRGSAWNSGTGTFTAPVTGWYQFNFAANAGLPATTGIMYIALTGVSGDVAEAFTTNKSGSTDQFSVVLSQVVPLTAGATIQPRYYLATGSVNLCQRACYFSATLIP